MPFLTNGRLGRGVLSILAFLVLSGALLAWPSRLLSGSGQSTHAWGTGSRPGPSASYAGAGAKAGEPDSPAVWTARVLGLAYLLAITCSGHTAAVPQLVVTSTLLDWLHLLAVAVWVGGMAAIALALLPTLRDRTFDGRVARADRAGAARDDDALRRVHAVAEHVDCAHGCRLKIMAQNMKYHVTVVKGG